MLHPGQSRPIHASSRPRAEEAARGAEGFPLARARRRRRRGGEAEGRGQGRTRFGEPSGTVGQNLEAPFSDISSAKLEDKDLPVEKIEIEQTM